MAKAKGATAPRRPRTSRSSGGLVTSVRRRLSLVEVEVDIGSEDNYLFSYLTDEQTLGIFVRTLAPLPAGTFLTLRFSAGPGPRIHVIADADDQDDPGADPRVDPRRGIELRADRRAAGDEPRLPRVGERGAPRVGDVLDEDLIEELTQDLTDAAAGASAQLETELDQLERSELDELDAAAAARLGELKLDGEVIWVNPYRPSVKDNLHPGMGIRLIALDDLTRARLLAMVGRFAYLT
jgi:hypothetical protein